MRRPWNIIDSPIYSLVTYEDDQLNMNICTYVTAISRTPKMYMVAIEQGSKTYEMLHRQDMAVLQILTKDQTKMIRPLGKRSGNDYDKETYLRKRDLLVDWKGYEVLKSAAAYVLLKKKEFIQTGDHDLFIFNAKKYSTFSEDNVLMFQDLIDQKIIL